MIPIYLVGKVVFYLTQDQIESLFELFHENRELKWASGLLIHTRDQFREACQNGNRFGIDFIGHMCI